MRKWQTDIKVWPKSQNGISITCTNTLIFETLRIKSNQAAIDSPKQNPKHVLEQQNLDGKERQFRNNDLSTFSLLSSLSFQEIGRSAWIIKYYRSINREWKEVLWDTEVPIDLMVIWMNIEFSNIEYETVNFKWQ
jgi:hypothetical protein